MPLLDMFWDPELHCSRGSQRGETVGQNHVKESNKEQVPFSWYLWHQTKEDTVAQATAAMETGVSSQSI